MQQTHQMPRNMRPCGLGTKDGQLSIQWCRHGIAALGEPSTVYAVTTYDSEVSRSAAYFEATERRVS